MRGELKAEKREEKGDGVHMQWQESETERAPQNMLEGKAKESENMRRNGERNDGCG